MFCAALLSVTEMPNTTVRTELRCGRDILGSVRWSVISLPGEPKEEAALLHLTPPELFRIQVAYIFI